MDYCEKTLYVREALIANPHKYGMEQKQSLWVHVDQCETCNEAIIEAEQMSKGMNHEFDS